MMIDELSCRMWNTDVLSVNGFCILPVVDSVD